jgi:alpha-tubulin suppressor-like RCC1 family protein
MFGTSNLTSKLNPLIDTSTSTVNLVQASGAVDSMGNVISVATRNALPTASANLGRFILILDEGSYVMSNGVTWSTSNFLRPGSEPTLYTWGRGGTGALGDGTTTTKSSPVSVVGGFTDWIDVGSGYDHLCGIRANGTAWSWGRNSNGQLGDGTTTSTSSPVSVVGGFTDWIQISVNRNGTSGLRANGTIWSWGNNINGQLGNNTTVSASSPVSVVGGFTDWVQVSQGESFAGAVRANGTIWMWGNNSSGRLGTNNTTARSSPVPIVGGFTDWVQLSCGYASSAALRANGTIWAWGSGSYGRLGSGSTTTRSSPVSVVGGFTDWVQVSHGGGHTIALRANGTLWSWGRNSNGQLGDNTLQSKSSPVSVVGGFTDWAQVSVGGNAGMGIRTNGTAWSWGRNYYGKLGTGNTISTSSPVSVIGGFTDWVMITGDRTNSSATVHSGIRG